MLTSRQQRLLSPAITLQARCSALHEAAGPRAETGLLGGAKARGVALGSPKLHVARKSAVASIKAEADRHAANVLPIIREAPKAGAIALRQIAEALNAMVWRRRAGAVARNFRQQRAQQSLKRLQAS